MRLAPARESLVRRRPLAWHVLNEHAPDTICTCPRAQSEQLPRSAMHSLAPESSRKVATQAANATCKHLFIKSTARAELQSASRLGIDKLPR